MGVSGAPVSTNVISVEIITHLELIPAANDWTTRLGTPAAPYNSDIQGSAVNANNNTASAISGDTSRVSGFLRSAAETAVKTAAIAGVSYLTGGFTPFAAYGASSAMGAAGSYTNPLIIG